MLKTLDTPPKTNMEPKNWWFVNVSPLPRGYFQVPCLFSGVYIPLKSYSGCFPGTLKIPKVVLPLYLHNLTGCTNLDFDHEIVTRAGYEVLTLHVTMPYIGIAQILEHPPNQLTNC